MKNSWLWLLGGLVACTGSVQVAPEVALKHPPGPAWQQQVALLQAKQVKLAAAPAVPTGAAMLNLEVLNPQNDPTQPDSLRQRVRRLARVVVADLASPGRYQVLSVQVVFRKGYFDANPSSQTFIYALASLR